ncbi:MAG: endopeptidase La [Chlamydiota bacterium]
MNDESNADNDQQPQDEIDFSEIPEIVEEAQKNTSDEEKPDEVYILPISRRPFFPGMAAPIIIEQGKYYEMLKIIAKTSHKSLGVFLTKDEDADITEVTHDDIHPVGVLAKILRIVPIEGGGGAQVVLNMENRLTITDPIEDEEYLRAHIESFDSSKVEVNQELKAYAISIISTIKELLKLNPLFQEELQMFLGHSDFTEPGKLADFAVALTTASREELQEVLETFDIRDRVEKALTLLNKEIDLSKLQKNINQKIETSLSETQREFFLREQLKTIKKELGIEKDEKTTDTDKFQERIETREIPEDVLKVINEELDKLNTLDSMSAEYAVCRNYLDWLTIIPWGIKSADDNTLKEAEDILEEDHFGLHDIKKRILEFISVGKLTGGIKGSIICLVGPPGVGKTSIGKSVARALNREFYRFSVGGVRDEAEIKGHRRTYIGAMPGKIIQALKLSQTMNPVIMIDEIDKMNSSYHGDPASAMLEVLDPEQNIDFLDHYLDVRCDLSDVLFIVTANVLDTIPAPLKDRMDIMRLSGYIKDEKIQIAKKYLIPRNRKKMGLKAHEVSFTKTGIGTIIEGYAREAGVRSLENKIKKIMRMVAVQIVKDRENKDEKSTSKVSITSKTVKDFLKKPVFNTDRYYDKTPSGVSVGLAWTAMGGATLYIEAIKVRSDKMKMKLTGQAGDVMKESSQIAWSYLHSAAERYCPKRPFFEKSEVHIHIPEGATPKDGPSAGITMVTALLSLLSNTPIKQNLAMTGEITLTGRVLAIGGIKEKIIAAKRAGMDTLIFPKDNVSDYEELADYIKKGIKVHFVKHYDEVVKIAFPKGFNKQ